MKVKVIQSDTRHIQIYTESRHLIYGPPNQLDLGLISHLNQDILHFPRDANSLGCLINSFKCQLNGYDYEFVKGELSDWEFNFYDDSTDKRHITWIKIKALYDQMNAEENKEIDIFCFLDTDAWIRKEDELHNVLQEFYTSSATIALPRDIEEKDSTFFNDGFLMFKNTEKGREIITKFWTNRDYRGYWKHFRVQQRLLSDYYFDHKDDYMVLPMADFNTPCGRIVRHCWIKHIHEASVLEEVIAIFSKIVICNKTASKISFGDGIIVLKDS